MVSERPEQDLVTRIANRAEEAIRDLEVTSRELAAAKERIRTLEAEVALLRAGSPGASEPEDGR